jgi:hypothetical protein
LVDEKIYPLVNDGKTMGKPWEMVGKLRENHGKMMIYIEHGHRNS